MNARPWLLASLLLAACSSPPPPAAPAPPAPAPGPAPPAQATAAPAASADRPPSAEVTSVTASPDGLTPARAKVVFSNPSKRACKVLAYTLVWAGSKKTITLQDLTLPPGETRERWIKVGQDDGNLAALTPEASKIELRTDCGG